MAASRSRCSCWSRASSAASSRSCASVMIHVNRIRRLLRRDQMLQIARQEYYPKGALRERPERIVPSRFISSNTPCEHFRFDCPSTVPRTDVHSLVLVESEVHYKEASYGNTGASR